MVVGDSRSCSRRRLNAGVKAHAVAAAGGVGARVERLYGTACSWKDHTRDSRATRFGAKASGFPPMCVSAESAVVMNSEFARYACQAPILRP
jgi:hypothetical protein